MKALTAHLRVKARHSALFLDSNGYLPLIHNVVSCTYEQWPERLCRRCCQLPVLEGACNAFGSLDWLATACQQLLAVWLVLAMLTGLTGFVYFAPVSIQFATVLP